MSTGRPAVGATSTPPELVLVGGASGSFMCAAGCGRTIAEFSSRQPRNSAVTANRTPMMIRLGMNLRVLAGGNCSVKAVAASTQSTGLHDVWNAASQRC